MTAVRSRTYAMPVRNRIMLNKLEFTLKLYKSVIINISVCLLAKNITDVCRLYSCDTISAKDMIYEELYGEKGRHITAQLYDLPEFAENMDTFQRYDDAELEVSDYLITERTCGVMNTLEFNTKMKLSRLVSMAVDLFALSLRDITDATGCTMAEACERIRDSLRGESYSMLVAEMFCRNDVSLSSTDLIVGMRA